MLFDPRLRISEKVAYAIECGGFGSTLPSVTITSEYHVPLTCEVRGDDVYVRAATGDEVEDMLTTGNVSEENTLPWPGDEPAALPVTVSWRERSDQEFVVEQAARLWSGEVLLNNGRGMAGPFYVYQMAAEAWAFATALSLPEGEVFECQVLRHACAWSQTPALLSEGEAAARRLSRFDMSPLRSWEPPSPVLLPGQLRSTVD
jgi:hypothetical protein